METSILLVGHGSRYLPGNEEIKQFSNKWQKMNPQWQIETCFIEFADVLLDRGLDNAAQRNGRVIVVPLILNAAGHVKMDIPQFIAVARERHPHVEFIYARHLGATESVFDILQRNLRKVLTQMDMPDPKTSGVILLGRGSSDRVANGEIAKMARWLFEESDHELIDIAFTGITYPRLETVMQRQVQLGMMQIVILPYYLFTGTLIERIKLQVERLKRQYPHTVIAHGHYFGFEDEIYSVLNERVAEASGDDIERTMMECDGCRYRKEAEGECHHHHDNHHTGQRHEHSYEHSHEYSHKHSQAHNQGDNRSHQEITV